MKIISIILTALVIAGCSGGSASNNISVYGKEIDRIASLYYRDSELGGTLLSHDESVKIYEELTNTVSKPYLLIITSPNLIRAVILRKELKHVMPNINGPYEPAPGYGDYTEYTALVVKRYKSGSLKPGDTLLISVSSQNWRSPYPEFNEGDEYLLSLTYPSDGKYLLTNQNNKKERASFLIKDNILYDRNGFWGMGTKAPWDKFEAAFMKDINRLRSDPPPEFLYD